MRIAILTAAVVAMLAASPAWAAKPAYIVVDVGAGSVIASRDSDKPWYPASVTKLMTAYLTFKALRSGQLKPTSPVLITANALAEPPSKMGYKVGTILNVDNALKMMIVKSANDIAVALAETVGGNEAAFVGQMNAEARALGMNSTVFRNPNGLPDPTMHTTARDLAVLANAIWTRYPEQRRLFQIPAIKAGRKILKSPNTLLERYPGANGMKTGFICSSGFNVVGSATRNGRTLMVVVLGAESSTGRAELAAKLLDQGFSGYFNAFGRHDLATFASAPSRAAPVDLRDDICGKKHKSEDPDAVVLTEASSSLGPRLIVMAPVPVFTGKADASLPGKAAVAAGTAPVKAGVAGGGAEISIPLPRPRPTFRAGAAFDNGRFTE